jgi:hypothetical protein
MSFSTSCCARCSRVRSAAFVGRRGVERRVTVRISVAGASSATCGFVIDLWAFPRTTRSVGRFSMLACRLSLLAPQPFGQGGLAIANSAPDFQERRSIAPHARFGEPRVTDAQTTCSLFGSEQALSTAYIARPRFERQPWPLSVFQISRHLLVLTQSAEACRVTSEPEDRQKKNCPDGLEPKEFSGVGARADPSGRRSP